MIKKILSLVVLIGLMMALSSVTNGQQKRYHDVSEEDWFYQEVYDLSSKGIISGFPDDTFRGDDTLHIDQFVKMIITGMGYEVVEDPEYWARPYIEKANELDLVKKGEIQQYDVPLIRGMAAVLIDRALTIKQEEIDLRRSTLYDMKGYTPIEYIDSVHKAYSAGIITGYPDLTFRYKSSITRGESAVMIVRLFDAEKRRVSFEDTWATLESVEAYLYSDKPSNDHIDIREPNLKEKMRPKMYEKIVGCVDALYDLQGYVTVEYREFEKRSYTLVRYYYDKRYAHDHRYSFWNFYFYNEPAGDFSINLGLDTMTIMVDFKMLEWSTINEDLESVQIGKEFFTAKFRNTMVGIFGAEKGDPIADYAFHLFHRGIPPREERGGLEKRIIGDYEVRFGIAMDQPMRTLTFTHLEK